MVHSPRRTAALFALAALAPLDAARAQASGTNPDISAIAEFIACPQGEEDCAYSEADGTLNFQELEVALQGYLNPTVRGDVFLAVHEGTIEAEEAYASFVRGLGPFQAKLGKFRLDWGNVNQLHPHAYSWIFQPLAEERFFGPEGLNQIAAHTNVSVPAGERSEVTFAVDLLRGDLADGGHDSGNSGDDSSPSGTICVGPGCADGICQPGDTDCALAFYDPADGELPDEGPDLAYHARVSWFDEVRLGHSVQAEANGLWGTLDPALDRNVQWLGGSLKYRFRPDKYRSLNLLGSYLRSRADLEAESTIGTDCVGPDCNAGACPPGGVCQEFTRTEQVKGGASRPPAGTSLLTGSSRSAGTRG